MASPDQHLHGVVKLCPKLCSDSLRQRLTQLIHFVFVPSILWTVLVWLSYTGALLPDLPDMYKPPDPLARCGLAS